MRRYLALGLALVAVGSCSPTGNDGSGPTVAVATVTVAPALDTVYIGAVSQLAATAKDADGNVLAGRSVTWSKTGSGATVSTGGLVTGTATGDVTVTATSEGITGNASIVVRPVPVLSVLLTPATDTIYLGATAQFTATPRDSIGGALTGRVTTWSSLDAAASVNNTGLVTSLSLGTARIVAYVEGKGDTSVVTVLPVPVASVVITPSADTLYPANTVQLAAVTHDSANGVLAGRLITWSSLDAAVSVSAGGLVTANSLGTARIVATSEGKADTALITVAAVPVATIVVTPAADTLYPTNTVQLMAVTRDSASNLLAGRVIVWSALDAAASVNGTGLVTASAVGTARIVATSEGKGDTAIITVLAVPVASVVLTPAGDTMPIGEVKQFVAATRDSVGGTLAGRTVSWSSTAPLVASVSASGLVTALDTGTTSVIGTSEGVSDTAVVLVTLRPVGSVVVTPAFDTVQIGDSAQFAATVLDTAGAPLAGRPVTWSSLDTTASVTASGRVHALVDGTARIVAAREGKADTALVTVTTLPVPPASLAGTWSGGGTSTGQGAFTILFQFQQTDSVLTGSWEDGNGGDVGSITGIVSGTSVVIHAAGTNGGLCTSDWTATRVGSDSLGGTFQSSAGCATSNNGSMAVHRVATTASVVITASVDTLILGDSAQFSAEARDSVNTTLNDRGVRWTSSDTTVVVIASGGMAHAAGLGTALLVAEGQGRADSVSVTVVPAPSSGEFPIAVTNLRESAGGLAGDGTNVLVGYQQEPQPGGTGTKVKFVLLDGSGAAIAAPIATGIAGDPPAVTYGGGQYLAIWASYETGTAVLTGLFINSAGAASGAAFPIRAGGGACGVAYAGGTFGALYSDATLPDSLSPVYFRRIAPDGTLGPEIVVAAAPSGCQLVLGMLASDGNGFLATFERPDGSEIRTRTISTSDSLGAINVVRSAVGGLGISHVTAIPGGWVAVWNEFGAGVHTAYAVLAPDGSGSTLGQLGESAGTQAIVLSARGTPDGFVAGWFERPADSTLTVTKVARYNVAGAALAPPTTVAAVVSGKFAIPIGIEPVGGGFLVLFERATLGPGIIQFDEETDDLSGIIVSP